MPVPNISVIIPCYNTGQYLGEAISSVLSQTLQDFEIVVVDDGSTDNTRKVVDSFEDPRIHYIHQENRGLAAARNAGARNSRGPLIAFLDADDTLMPDKLEAQKTFLEEHPEYGLIAAHFERVDAHGEPLNPSPVKNLPGGPISIADVLVDCPFATHATLFSREWFERVGMYDEELEAAEDWDLYCRLAIAGCRMYKMNRTICFYRHSPTSMSLRGRRQTEFMLRVVDKSFANPGLPTELRDLEPRARAETYLKGMARCYAGGDFEVAESYLRRALELLAELGELDCDHVAEHLHRLISYTKIADADAYYQGVLEHFPADAPGAPRARESILIKVLEVRIRSSFRERRASGLLRASFELMYRAPFHFALWILGFTARKMLKGVFPLSGAEAGDHAPAPRDPEPLGPAETEESAPIKVHMVGTDVERNGGPRDAAPGDLDAPAAKRDRVPGEADMSAASREYPVNADRDRFGAPLVSVLMPVYHASPYLAQ
ncbi:glycosyltransferase, partial [bacterium]|nr:glycosyltransferase [bacterium]